MNVLMLLTGALAGWCTHPLLWVMFSPWRFMFYVFVTSAQESQHNPLATGDKNEWGMVQILPSTAAVYRMTEADARNPFSAGYFCAAYVDDALKADWTWWVMRAPYYGASAFRVLWRSGIGSADKWRDGLDNTYAGVNYWPTYWRYVAIPTILTLSVLGGLFYKASKIKVTA